MCFSAFENRTLDGQPSYGNVEGYYHYSDRIEIRYPTLVLLLRPDYCPLTEYNPGLLPAFLLDIPP